MIARAAYGERSAAVNGPELARRRLAEWSAEHAAAARARAPSRPLVELGERMQACFTRSDDVLAQAGRRGRGAAGALASALADARDKARGSLADDEPLVHPGDIHPKLRKGGLDGRVPKACFGACGDGNLIAALAAVVQIDHDDRGAPAAAHLWKSSGDAGFDRAAVAAANEVAQGNAAVVAHDADVRWSRWELESETYRYSRLDLLLDPLFQPPGRTVESASGLGGKTTVVGSVRLLAVATRETGAGK